MKPHQPNRLLLALLATALPLFTSCSSTPKVEKSGTSSYKQGVPGGILVETYDFTGTITRVDPNARTVTLLAPDGSYNTFKASPGDKQFAQYRDGEKVKASVARELIVFLKKSGGPIANGPSAQSTLAAKEGAIDVLVSKEERRDAIVAAVDKQQRLVMLKFSDGTTKTFPVRKDVNVGEMHPGDEVVILTGSAVALKVEKQ
jgi:hypothetical protein